MKIEFGGERVCPACKGEGIEPTRRGRRKGAIDGIRSPKVCTVGSGSGVVK